MKSGGIVARISIQGMCWDSGEVKTNNWGDKTMTSIKNVGEIHFFLQHSSYEVLLPSDHTRAIFKVRKH